MAPTLVWFRLDLRLSDHPSLHAALARKTPIIPVFIRDPKRNAPWSPGAASRWWLHQSLTSLQAELEKCGSRLVLKQGDTRQELLGLLRETHANCVLWNRRYGPTAPKDRKLITDLRKQGVETETVAGDLLFEPETVHTKGGDPFQVFTPFWNRCLALPPPEEPLPRPRRLPSPEKWPASVRLEELALEPRIDWCAGMRKEWRPGSKGAQKRLKSFLKEAVSDYSTDRDRPDRIGTSRLSPHLHFGEISPRQIWHDVHESEYLLKGKGLTKGAESFLREVGWREFAHHLLHHFPHTTTQPLRPRFKAFPWRRDRKGLRAWQQGRTGFPIVDAGMRELWATGWMHNRVRMIVASFLIKDLLVPWQEGAKWFWDTLVDADLANNTLGWQWTAGCGADAAPFFRVFNPMSQGEKFDPNGKYVRRWIPEIAALPDSTIHRPWEADSDLQKKIGLGQPGKYPHPIVDHSEARERALDAFAQLPK